MYDLRLPEDCFGLCGFIVTGLILDNHNQSTFAIVLHGIRTCLIAIDDWPERLDNYDCINKWFETKACIVRHLYYNISQLLKRIARHLYYNIWQKNGLESTMNIHRALSLYM